MIDIIISTEATLDLPKDIIEKYDIKYADMHYSIDDKEYYTADNNFTFEEFYNKMKQGSMTRTSQINEFEAREYFEELLKQGKDIVHISTSSNLSGMINNFKKVAEELNETNNNKIYVVDSLAGSFALGLLCIYAREKCLTANSAKEVADFIENNKQRANALFTVDDLKYLYRNGRLSKLSAFIGGLLKIKPYLHLDENGKLAMLSKVISRKKSLQTLADNTIKYSNCKICKLLFIAHANCKEDAEFIKHEVEKNTDMQVILYDLGIVIGAHSGPGTLATFFLSDKRY